MTVEKYKLTYNKFGESSILIEWPSRIDPAIIQDIVSFEKQVSKHQKVVDTIIAYNSLTILYQHIYDYSIDYQYQNNFTNAVAELKKLYVKERTKERIQQKVWQIPVCCDIQFGIDLEEIAQQKKLSVDEVIQLHTQPKYLIYFLGFQPGFMYLGGLDERIHTPRRPTPRLRVEKGSVGIGGEQTGIYPTETSGGWNIIGKSPIDFFDISKSKPCFAKAGEFIQFVAIDLNTYEQIVKEMHRGTYQLKCS